MPSIVRRSSLPLTALALTVSLGGCVAAPLAQLAVSKVTPTPTPTCGPATPGCTQGGNGFSMADLTHGLGQSLQKLTGDTPTPTTAAK